MFYYLLKKVGESMAGSRKKTKIDVSEKDWTEIKTEYITGDMSYRALAQKHRIGYSRLQARATAEKWAVERGAFQKKVSQKSLDLICDEQAERIARAVRIGDRMLEKVEESLEQIDMILCERTVSTKKTEPGKDGIPCEKTTTKKSYSQKKVAIDRAGLRQLSAVLKDLREIGIFRSELDKKEQEARINKLQKDTEKEQKDTTINVQIKAAEVYDE